MRPAATLDEFFAGYPDSRRIFDTLRATVDAIGPHDCRVSKSQVAFRRRVNFAMAWIPGLYLGVGRAPLVLTVLLRRRDASPRWKEVVEPHPGRFTHHLELSDDADLDGEVRDWLLEAWRAAE